MRGADKLACGSLSFPETESCFFILYLFRNLESWASYRCARNQVTNKIRKAKGMYNQGLIDNDNEDPKSFWKIGKRILPAEIKKINSNS